MTEGTTIGLCFVALVGGAVALTALPSPSAHVAAVPEPVKAETPEPQRKPEERPTATILDDVHMATGKRLHAYGCSNPRDGLGEHDARGPSCVVIPDGSRLPIVEADGAANLRVLYNGSRLWVWARFIEPEFADGAWRYRRAKPRLAGGTRITVKKDTLACMQLSFFARYEAEPLSLRGLCKTLRRGTVVKVGDTLYGHARIGGEGLDLAHWVNADDVVLQ